MNIKNSIDGKTSKTHLYSVLFFTTCFLLFLAEWLLFTEDIGGIGNKYIVTITKGIGDVAALFLIYWFLPQKRKWIILVIIWLVSVFFLFNTWHCRFWGEFISVTFYRLASNMNADLVNSVKALVRITDIFYILIPAACTLLYLFVCRKHMRTERNFSQKQRVAAVCMSLFAFALSQLAFGITTKKWQEDSFPDDTLTDILLERFCFNKHTVKYTFCSEGLCMYFLEAGVEIGKDIVSRHYIELNETDLRKISDFMADIPEIPGTPDFSANKDKNVVIILVESLNSDVIFHKINGNEITPVMNALVNAENTVSALNIVPQVKEGCSNDGQLLTNTGLLPLDKGVSSMLFGDRNIYPSLPRILARKKPTVIFGDNGATWNQTGAYEGYGFEEILNIHDYEKAAEEKGRDAAMMDLGIEIISRLEEPFLLELVTFSMHVPFKEKAVPTEEWLKTDSLEENERNYYNITHYFDRSLGDFINKLKSMNKYDDTVIFIVSDHSQGIAKNKKVFKDGDNNRQDFLPMAFIALNTGHTQKVDAPAGQVNVFPTILHILNRNNEPYHGIDRSLLDPQLSSSVTQQGKTKGNATLSEISRQRRAYDIADSIQRGDYFRQIETPKKK